MSDYDWPDFPVILGQGSCHTLNEYVPRKASGKPKPVKNRPIGFHLPPKPKR